MSVVCHICNQPFQVVNSFHLAKHGLMMTRYRELFPDVSVYSVECSPWFGKRLPQSMRDRLSTIRLERGIPAWNKGKTKATDVRVAGYAASLLGKIRSPEHCRNISLSKKGHATSIDHRIKLSRANRRNFDSPEYCLWWGQIHASKPTKLELDLLTLLEDNFPGEWKYTGDFTFSVNRCNPDFIRVNGHNTCIEVYHPYWKVRKWGSVERYRRLRGQAYTDARWEVLFLDDDDVRKSPDTCIRKVAELLA